MNYEGTEVLPIFSNYVNNGNLALQFTDEEDGSPYGVVTVNLDEILPKNQAYIDTNNFGGYKIVSWLERNGFGKDTGLLGYSGFCQYPLFEFNQEVIDKYEV